MPTGPFNRMTELEFRRRFKTPEQQRAARELDAREAGIKARLDARLKTKTDAIDRALRPHPPGLDLVPAGASKIDPARRSELIQKRAEAVARNEKHSQRLTDRTEALRKKVELAKDQHLKLDRAKRVNVMQRRDIPRPAPLPQKGWIARKFDAWRGNTHSQVKVPATPKISAMREPARTPQPAPMPAVELHHMTPQQHGLAAKLVMAQMQAIEAAKQPMLAPPREPGLTQTFERSR